jgi:hypothetical protein
MKGWVTLLGQSGENKQFHLSSIALGIGLPLGSIAKAYFLQLRNNSVIPTLRHPTRNVLTQKNYILRKQYHLATLLTFPVHFLSSAL